MAKVKGYTRKDGTKVKGYSRKDSKYVSRAFHSVKKGKPKKKPKKGYKWVLAPNGAQYIQKMTKKAKRRYAF